MHWKPKNSFFWLYCGACFVAVVWNRTCSISKVCLHFFSSGFCVLLLPFFWLLKLPGQSSPVVPSVLCSNFWEFPSTFIFPAFSSMVVVSFYRRSFILRLLFFLLITSCYFMESKSLTFLKGVWLRASFLLLLL